MRSGRETDGPNVVVVFDWFFKLKQSYVIGHRFMVIVRVDDNLGHRNFAFMTFFSQDGNVTQGHKDLAKRNSRKSVRWSVVPDAPRLMYVRVRW